MENLASRHHLPLELKWLYVTKGCSSPCQFFIPRQQSSSVTSLALFHGIKEQVSRNHSAQTGFLPSISVMQAGDGSWYFCQQLSPETTNYRSQIDP